MSVTATPLTGDRFLKRNGMWGFFASISMTTVLVATAQPQGAISTRGSRSNRAAETAGRREPAHKYSIVDGHLHYLNFVQETSGMDALLRAMDDAGVAESVVIGMPLVKKWDEGDSRRPTYYMDTDSRTYWYSATDFLVARAVMDLAKEKRSRLHPFICGFNSTDRNAVDHVERMLKLYPGLWQGIGEVFLRHDDLTALTYGETPRATSTAFAGVLDLAAQRSLPVLVHSNIGPAWLQQPDYLSEIETAIRTHPHTRIIWAHAGISRRIVIANHTDILRRMLSTYPNLTIDLMGGGRAGDCARGRVGSEMGEPHR